MHLDCPTFEVVDQRAGLANRQIFETFDVEPFTNQICRIDSLSPGNREDSPNLTLGGRANFVPSSLTFAVRVRVTIAAGVVTRVTVAVRG